MPPKGDPGANVASSSLPGSYRELLAMSPDELAKLDLAVLDLLCAAGLPGAEKLDIPVASKKLDEWAARIKAETERHLYRLKDPQYAEHYANSEARLRAEFIVQVLQEDCGVHYNVERINQPDFSDSKDGFLHGMIDSDNGGTCASMPVMYAAIGRRLGYPIKLAVAKEHIFCRWEGATERLNFDGAANGGLDFPTDDYYRQWPFPISDEEMAAEQYLRSMTPQQELATFLLQRGTCLQANGRWPEAREVFAEAHRLTPDGPEIWAALRQSVLDEALQPTWARRGSEPAPQRRPGPGPRRTDEDELREAIRQGMPADPTPHPPMPGGPIPTIPGPPPPPSGGPGKP